MRRNVALSPGVALIHRGNLRHAATPYSRIGMTERRSMADASNRMRDAIANASVVIGVDTGIS